jgi:hypothetical protein
MAPAPAFDEIAPLAWFDAEQLCCQACCWLWILAVANSANGSVY